MHVDVSVELARQLENAPDLFRSVRVVARRCADDPRTSAQPFNEQFLRPRDISQPVLGKDTNLQIDGPPVVVGELFDRVKSSHPDQGIYLYLGSNMCRASKDAFLQRALRARVNILLRNLRLDRRRVRHRVDVAPGLRRTPIEKVGFVEVNVRFDEAAADKASGGVICRTLRREIGLNRNNAPTVYPNIQVLAQWSVGELCSSYYQVHGSMCPMATLKRIFSRTRPRRYP